MIHSAERKLFILLLMGLIGYFLYEASGYRRAELSALPMLIGIPTLILLILCFLGEFFPRISSIFDKKQNKDGSNEVIVSFMTMEEDVKPDNKKLLQISLWFVIIGILLFYFGFLIVIPVMSFVFGVWIVRFNLWRSLIVTLIPSIIMILAYYFLQDSMFEGLFFDAWIPRF